MTRTRASAKAAGTTLETDQVRWLQQVVDDRIERRARNGAKDRGDISGVRTFRSGRVVIECKNYGGRIDAATWIKEAETERLNDDAIAGVVMIKRKGTTNPAEQYVLMTAADFAAILTGLRPGDDT